MTSQFTPRSGSGMVIPPFWSEIDNLVTITSTAADQALKDVVVADIPAGSVVKRAIALLKYREVVDTSGAENSLVLAGTEHIQVRVSGGTYIDAIKLIAGMCLTKASSNGNGDIWFGDLDLTEEFPTPNATYNFQWEGADVTGNNLLFRDLQVGLLVFFI